MENVAEIRDQLQKVVDLLCKTKKYEQGYMVNAQKLGLQGEKRRFRYESAKVHNLINFYICDIFDTYGLSLKNEEQAVSVAPIGSISAYFDTVLEFLESKHDNLHAIANKLVTLNAQHAATKLYDKCRCIIEDIKYYRRTIQEGKSTGWSTEFMLLHQTTQCNIHDHFEKKEREMEFPG